MEPQQNWDREPGRRSQLGGVIAVAIGILLWIFLPVPPPGSPVDFHRMSYACIAVGILGIAVGTVAANFFSNSHLLPWEMRLLHSLGSLLIKFQLATPIKRPSLPAAPASGWLICLPVRVSSCTCQFWQWCFSVLRLE